MNIQSVSVCKSSVADGTHKWLVSAVASFVSLQTFVCGKPFVTHCAQIRSWLVIMWMLSDIITISFSLHFNRTLTCIICTHQTLFSANSTSHVANMMKIFVTKFDSSAIVNILMLNTCSYVCCIDLFFRINFSVRIRKI